MNKKTKGTLAILLLFGTLSISWYVQNYSYQQGKGEGYTMGFNSGLTKGQREGYFAGYNNGTKIGSEQGYNSGYLNGTKEGYESGYLKGIKDGAGTGYNIRDPTYSEMLTFIKSDTTNTHTYSSSYTCFYFCNDVIEHAFNQGIKCGLVYIEFSDECHTIVCFKTTDRGLIYVEPQTDQITTVIIGQIFQTSGYEPMGTVKSFTVVW